MIGSHGAWWVTAQEKLAPPDQGPTYTSGLPPTNGNTAGAAQLLVRAKLALLSPPWPGCL